MTGFVCHAHTQFAYNLPCSLSKPRTSRSSDESIATTTSCVIYFLRSTAGTIYLLYAYAKYEQADLSADQRKLLVQWARRY